MTERKQEDKSQLAKGMDAFQANIGDWCAHNFPDTVGWQALLGVVEEVGELSHAYLKCSQGIRGTTLKHRNDMVDAIGDMLVYTANFCNLEGISIADCMEVAWNEIKNRDWKQFPKNGKTE